MAASPSAMFVTFRKDSLNLAGKYVEESCKGATSVFNLFKICVFIYCIHAQWNMLLSHLKENNVFLKR